MLTSLPGDPDRSDGLGLARHATKKEETVTIAEKFTVALAVAFVWTTVFSLTINASWRGLRNFGIMASYLVGIGMFIIAGIKPAALTWGAFGLLSGTLAFVRDLVVRVRADAEDEKPAITAEHFICGQFAWPIMGPEAIESGLVSLGVLRARRQWEQIV
ncbi:MAG: hypothetical protein PHR35_09530 [Kiritimatiellae bacterium]|nr:hypothetical protein [Kiritimatiellia bacterium]